MLSSQEIRRLAETCVTIADAAAEGDGFVPIRQLLEQFHAQLIIRPLLVEGMLASLQGAAGRATWAVLVDSDQYSITHDDVRAESTRSPLPQRLRNTIAHELAHSLVFRPAEFGIELRTMPKSADGAAAHVQDFERETERLSPLLLWPERALVKLVTERSASLSLADLQRERLRLGISRDVLINRFNMMGVGGRLGLGHCSSVRNLGIGVGEWTESGRAVLRSWPLFINFDRNIVPRVLLEVSSQDRLPATSVFPEAEFALCGGSLNSCEFAVDAGISSMPAAERMRIECTAEAGSRAVNSRFLFLVRKLS